MRMDTMKLSRGQRLCASVLVVIWGVTFFLVAALAGLAVMICCGFVFGYFGLTSELYREIAGVISAVVLLLSIVLLIRWQKQRDFILRSSIAVVLRFSHRDEHDA